MNRSHNFTFIDLFAGIGGFRLGFQSMGGKCVFSSEIDKFAQKTYRMNHFDHIAGDINCVDINSIPSHDVLLAGFPCQPFSSAGIAIKNTLGKKHGFDDRDQGVLFFKIVEILHQHQPSMFLLENVKNLKSYKRGTVWKRIKEELYNAGYDLFYRIIDAQHFVPQHRERIYIIGFRKDKSQHYHFNFDAMNLPSKGPKLNSILEDKVDSKYTLTDTMWNYHQRHKAKHKAKGTGYGYSIADIHSVTRTLTSRYYKDGAEILIKQRGKNPRKLTPRECARLMGFPDDFEIVVSDTQAYKQFGNAVVVPVVARIARFMFPYITSSKTI